VENIIGRFVEEVKSNMPSSGFWPFTLLKMENSDFGELSFSHQVRSSHLLLILLRTDFSIADVKDFLLNSKELSRLPLNLQSAQLDEMLAKIESDEDLDLWKEKIISMCVGIAIQIARNMNLCLKPVYADLSEVDKAFRYYKRHLCAFMLFNICMRLECR